MPANYRQVDSVERKLDWSSRRRFLTNGLVAGSAALAFARFAQPAGDANFFNWQSVLSRCDC